MIPRTRNGHSPLLAIAVVQKAIRRNDHDLAMGWTVEMLHSGKRNFTMVWNRLIVTMHEDCDVAANPSIVPFVEASYQQALRFWKSDPEKLGKVRMITGNVIRVLCATPKSRIGDHFGAAHGFANLLDGDVPDVPDYCYDKHTTRGRKLGRDLEHFRANAAQLAGRAPYVPGGPAEDEYADRAYAMWARLEAGAKPTDANSRRATDPAPDPLPDDPGPTTLGDLFGTDGER